jgi:hypothetical protein
MRSSAVATTIEVPPLCLRAEVSSYNEEDRTVDMVFSTGAGVERYDWGKGTRYIEKLEISEKAIRLGRLNAGAPLLDSHSAWSVEDILGAVVEGSARVEKGKAVARVRFSARDRVAGIIRDVRDRVITAVSVGYRVHSFIEDNSKGDKLPVRTAVDWEPYEVSLVGMPADANAKIRRDDVATNPCVLVLRADAVLLADADRDRRLRYARLSA